MNDLVMNDLAMNDLARHFAETACLGDKVSRVYRHRSGGALKRFSERASETLPRLVADPSDRGRLLDLIVNDPRIDAASVTDEQRNTYRRILGALDADKPAPVRGPRRARGS